MREHLEIAPEIRGLLEELVADPRSSIRLMPRKPLRSWFESDEKIHDRSVSETRLGRHLVEAHREELAQLLFEASRIAYWKSSAYSVPPMERDGGPFDPVTREEAWQEGVRRGRGASDATIGEIALLRDCMSRIAPDSCLQLATASLALAPSDKARFAVVLAIPRDRPRTAMKFLDRIIERTKATPFRQSLLWSMAALRCSVLRLHDAREAYREAIALGGPDASLGWLASLNLSCFLQDESAAREEAAEFCKVAPGGWRQHETLAILKAWASQIDRTGFALARDTASRVSSGAQSTEALGKIFES